MTKNKHIQIRTMRRSTPDIRKLSRALIALAQAQREADAARSQRVDTADQVRPRTAQPPDGSAP